MNDVADDQREFVGHIPNGLELEDLISVIGIYLDEDTAEVRFEKLANKLLEFGDVLIGPFDL